MKDNLTYTLSKTNPLKIGYEGEHMYRAFTLRGYTMDDESNLLVMILNYGDKRKYVPLLGYYFEVDESLMQYQGSFEAQLVEFEIEDDTQMSEILTKIHNNEKWYASMVGKSMIFPVRITGSIPIDGEMDVISPSFEMWIAYCITMFNNMQQLHDEVERKLENHEFDGYTPVKGVDYWTESDKDEIRTKVKIFVDNDIKRYEDTVEEVLEDDIKAFNENATLKTQQFNTNASNQIDSFNANVTSKTSGFNTNAENKQSSFDTNVNTKTEAFNSNATSKTNEFNSNVTSKLNEFNASAEAKTNEELAKINTDEVVQTVDRLNEDLSNVKPSMNSSHYCDLFAKMHGYVSTITGWEQGRIKSNTGEDDKERFNLRVRTVGFGKTSETRGLYLVKNQTPVNFFVSYYNDNYEYVTNEQFTLSNESSYVKKTVNKTYPYFRVCAYYDETTPISPTTMSESVIVGSPIYNDMVWGVMDTRTDYNYMFYSEESERIDTLGLYLKFDTLYVRGSCLEYTLPKETTSDIVAETVSVDLVTSPKGVYNCLKIPHNHALVYDTLTRGITLKKYTNEETTWILTSTEIPLFICSMGKCVGGVLAHECYRYNNKKAELNDFEELYLGDFVQGGYTASGIADRNDRIVMNEVVAFPYDNIEIKVSMNGTYTIGVRVGESATNLYENLYWYRDGDIISIPKGRNYYRIAIASTIGEQPYSNKITPSEYSSINLKLLVRKKENLHSKSEINLNSARLSFKTNAPNSLFNLPTIAHTSDCHGDYKRVDNFLDFCDKEGVDVACITGDIVSYDPSHGIKWFMESVNNHKSLSAICTGNHDVYNSSYTDNDIYNFMFADIANKIGNTTGKTWYHKDITSKKIRIISVNLYQYGGGSRWYTHFSQEQINWIIDVLKSTPSGYGVVMLEHAPQVSLDNAKSETYKDFFQNTRLYNGLHNDVNGTPLYDIVDAFIGKTTLSKSYTQTGNPSSVIVSADFTNVASGTEFIAHLTGHFHQDTICYLPNRTYKQLMLNVTCTNALYGGSEYPYLSDISDQGRYKNDSSQDAFNVYVIDRENKQVKIVRIGNDMTYDMNKREYMVIPYI